MSEFQLKYESFQSSFAVVDVCIILPDLLVLARTPWLPVTETQRQMA